MFTSASATSPLSWPHLGGMQLPEPLRKVCSLVESATLWPCCIMILKKKYQENNLICCVWVKIVALEDWKHYLKASDTVYSIKPKVCVCVLWSTGCMQTQSCTVIITNQKAPALLYGHAVDPLCRENLTGLLSCKLNAPASLWRL